MRISDWSSDVCSSDLHLRAPRLEQADREVGWGAAEQVGQHDDAATLADAANRVGDLLTPHLHTVVGAAADGRDRALRADDMLHSGHHFLGESAMVDENHSEQRQVFIAGTASDYPTD